MLPPLNALRTFEAAARHLNFSRAADELHVTPSAVSHQIKDLEAFLGHALFIRQGRDMSLSPAGQLLLPGIQTAFLAVGQAVDGLRVLRQTRALAVSVPPSVAMKWLVPRLSGFHDAYPDIDVHMVTNLGPPGAGVFDIAVHYGDGRYPNLQSELLAANAVAAMCSPALLGGAHPLKRMEDLRHVTLLHDSGSDELGNPAYRWDDWLTQRGVDGVDASTGLHFSTSADLLNAAAAGAGVAIGKTALAADDLKAGRLVCLFGDITPEPMAYYVIYARGALGQPNVRAFRDWLFAEFADEAG